MNYLLHGIVHEPQDATTVSIVMQKKTVAPPTASAGTTVMICHHRAPNQPTPTDLTSTGRAGPEFNDTDEEASSPRNIISLPVSTPSSATVCSLCSSCSAIFSCSPTTSPLATIYNRSRSFLTFSRPPLSL